MKCEKCGAEVKDEWSYCPRCGQRKRSRIRLDNIFSRFRKEFEEMDRMFERNFEAFDISPFFGKPKSSGFTIKIVSSNKQPPRVSVKGFGGVDERKLEEQIRNQMGISGSEGTEGAIPEPEKRIKKPLKMPEMTEEPEAKIRREGAKVVVEMDIPGVESEDDIEIRELENSVEVKAVSKDKAFFKILTKPGQSRLAGKRFEKGRLHLEFS